MSVRSSSSGQGGPRRAPRADAQRNRDLLLVAASEVFDERGPDAPLDEIARRAGIGNATMYRHFPDRRELLIAVYADEVTALCKQGEAMLESQSPEEALFAWLRAFIAHVATKRHLAFAIPRDHESERSAQFDQWHAAMRSTATALLTRARSAGVVRADVNVADLLAVASGIAVAAAVDDDQTERCLELLRHGVAR